ncbi:MAG: TRAP transporter substrate-binding protein [Alphaproteobacteria bacterium]
MTSKNLISQTRRRLARLGLAAGLVAALGSLPAAAQEITLRFGSPLPEDTLYHQAILRFADEVATRSDGRLMIDVFPASQLGGIAEMLSSVQAGSLDMTMAVPAWYSGFIKPMDVFTLPYLVGSQDKLRPALDGAVGDKIAELGRSAGFEIVGYWLMGGRHIVNRVRPVHSPADLEGLKIRVINSQVYMTAFRALGANPVAMDPAELYLALQNGVVDGFGYPLPDLIPYKLYEVADNLTLDTHAIDFFVISMSAGRWDGLAPEDQAIIEESMAVAMDWQWAEQPKAIEAALEELRGLMTVTEISAEERQAFIDATRPIYGEFEESIGEDLMTTAVDALAN